MKIQRQLIFSWLMLIFGVGMVQAQTKAFSITASNVTMPTSGNGISSYTVTGIPSTGSLIVSCTYSGPSTAARIPSCSYGPLAAYPVTAGQTFNGEVLFFPFGSAIPAQQRAARRFSDVPAVPALAAALLIGLGIRRGTRRWIVIAFVSAIALAGVSACGGNPTAMTPGTYPYTITAGDEANPNTPLGQGVSTTINVTVP
jgi:hypothetical protein